ncbi:MAG: EAL domain-containing protein [Pseudomonadota bacterium]
MHDATYHSIVIDHLIESLGADQDHLLPAAAAAAAELELQAADAQLLASLKDEFDDYRDLFGQRLVAHLKSFDTPPPITQTSLERMRQAYSSYFSASEHNRCSPQMVNRRSLLGSNQPRAKALLKWYTGTFRKYAAQLLPILWLRSKEDLEKYERTSVALLKVLYFDICVAVDSCVSMDNQALAKIQDSVKHATWPPVALLEMGNMSHSVENFARVQVGLARTTMDGTILSINDRLSDILGYDETELVGRKMSDITFPEDVEKTQIEVNRLLEDHDLVIKIQKRYVRKDGVAIWAEAIGSFVHSVEGKADSFQIVIEDVSARKQLESMLSLSNRALATSNCSMLIADACDSGFPIIFANPAFCKMTGYALDEVIGRNCRFLQGDDTDQPEIAVMRNTLAKNEGAHVVLRNYRKDGSMFWNDVLISPVPDDSGKVSHFISVQNEVSEQSMGGEKRSFQSTLDELTGLPNRNLLNDRLKQSILHASRRGNVAALLFLNVDHFKFINDSVGYAMGDEFIKSFAVRLVSSIRSGDTVARHGGDEFIIVLNDLEKSEQVSIICDKIFAAISKPFLIQDEVIHATCSIGIALFPQDGNAPATLCKYADLALHRAKDLGRANFQFFSNELSQRNSDRVLLENALRLAIGTDQLCMHYQPLMDLRTGKVSSLEALIRWQHPELGVVSPDRFIPIAEESGLIGVMGEWVLHKVCEDMRHWMESGLELIKVGLNLSPKQFRDRLLGDKIEAALRENGIPPQSLGLEITETALMQDTASSEATLRQFQRLGISLSLDDFGTGYSSLSYLKRFPFDTVKIDRAFIRDIVSDNDDAALSKAIISMVHSLGMTVVAEGVETEDQCEFLRRNMCDQIQGFFFSKALPPREVEALLLADRRLPSHLLRMQKKSRTLLLVDDEQNIVSALKRLLRRDGYEILTANSGQEGLDLMAQHAVDVIVSDQRMPGMIGADFLRKAKEFFPNTIRIMLSGYTELQSVTDAVNEGAIYKFLTKPWDDELLRGHISDAFKLKEIADHNERLDLEVRTANHELAAANRKMEDVLQQKQQQIKRDEISLNIAREVLQHLPLAVIGLDDEGMVAFVNGAAQSLFKNSGAILGSQGCEVLPEVFLTESEPTQLKHRAELTGAWFDIVAHPMGANSRSQGQLITISRSEVQT